MLFSEFKGHTEPDLFESVVAAITTTFVYEQVLAAGADFVGSSFFELKQLFGLWCLAVIRLVILLGLGYTSPLLSYFAVTRSSGGKLVGKSWSNDSRSFFLINKTGVFMFFMTVVTSIFENVCNIDKEICLIKSVTALCGSACIG